MEISKLGRFDGNMSIMLMKSYFGRIWMGFVGEGVKGWKYLWNTKYNGVYKIQNIYWTKNVINILN